MEPECRYVEGNVLIKIELRNRSVVSKFCSYMTVMYVNQLNHRSEAVAFLVSPSAAP